MRVATPRLLTALNVTCLDAPIVAAVWQDAFARALHVELIPAQRIALAATAWLIYLADRFADSFTIPAGAKMSLRQQFTCQHRVGFCVAIVFATLLDAFAIPHLDRATVVAGAFTAAACLVYLALNHFAGRFWGTLPLKEIAIGTLFAAGVRSSFMSAGGSRFGPAALLFGVLCALNCISIAFWERDLDRAQNRSSIATAFPSLQRWPIVACFLLTFTASVTLGLTSLPLPVTCIALSALLLALLNLRGVPLSRDVRTALADIVLLTPLLALPFQR